VLDGTGFEPYHVGVVVTDVRSAMVELSSSLGVTWGREQFLAGPGAGGEPDFGFSLGGPPYYELIKVRPGTVWANLGPHHVAVWCDDLAEAGMRVLAAGWRWEQGKYFVSRTGVRHELVPRGSYGPRLRRYLDGGDMFLAGDGPESYSCVES
jgi:hypothetical protein